MVQHRSAIEESYAIIDTGAASLPSSKAPPSPADRRGEKKAVCSDAMTESLGLTQESTTQDGLGLFAYGSLMARPALPWTQRVEASLLGYRRRFWQGSHDHRGARGPGTCGTPVPSEDGPGKQGKACEGLLYYHRRWPRAPSLTRLSGKEWIPAALGRCGTALGSAAEPWSICDPGQSCLARPRPKAGWWPSCARPEDPRGPTSTITRASSHPSLHIRTPILRPQWPPRGPPKPSRSSGDGRRGRGRTLRPHRRGQKPPHGPSLPDSPQARACPELAGPGRSRALQPGLSWPPAPPRS